MKANIAWKLCTVWLAGVVLCAPTVRAGAVRGWVTGLSSGDSAVVKVTGGYPQQASTQPGGQWEIPFLSPGTYEVQVENNAYSFEPPNRLIKVPEGDLGAINFKATPKRAAPVRVGTISGRVIGLSAKDLVRILAEGPWPTDAKSKPGGAFKLSPKAAGPYRLHPEDARYRFVPAEVELKLDEADIKGLVIRAEKKSKRHVEAPLISSPGGSEAEQAPPPTFRLSGKVSGLKADGVATLQAEGPKYYETKTVTDGSFAFNKIEAGRYQLSLLLPACDGCSYHPVPAGLTLEVDGDTAGIEFIANPKPVQPPPTSH